MAIALVKMGTLSQVAAATISPAYGQATAAGHLVVARVTAQTTVNATPTTSATGWAQAVAFWDNNQASAAIWFKPNCGASETAPTFTCTSATAMKADLLEFSGVATTSPLDQSGTSSLTPACTAPDTNASDVAVVVGSINASKSSTLTVTDSWSPAGGTVVAAQGSGATKQINQQWGSAYLLGGNGGGSADSDTPTETPSTGVLNDAAHVIASFKPPATGPAETVQNIYVVPTPAVQRASW